MQDLLFVEEPAQAGALLHPLRLSVLKRLAEPRSCPDLARDLDETTQKVYYHVKILEEAGLVDKVDERRVRGIMEGLYQARARSYWLSPRIVGRIGGPARTRDQMSLGFLLTLAEEIQLDVARLAARPGAGGPSLGLSAHIELRDPSARAAFLSEVQEIFKRLARKYGQGAGARSPSFKISLVCYPKSGKAREWQE
jgi:DNA-binding transcriptional ArsR family regulator